nr:unnamed protein product [Callosobruchus chinensis]
MFSVEGHIVIGGHPVRLQSAGGGGGGGAATGTQRVVLASQGSGGQIVAQQILLPAGAQGRQVFARVMSPSVVKQTTHTTQIPDKVTEANPPSSSVCVSHTPYHRCHLDKGGCGPPEAGNIKKRKNDQEQTQIQKVALIVLDFTFFLILKTLKIKGQSVKKTKTKLEVRFFSDDRIKKKSYPSTYFKEINKDNITNGSGEVTNSGVHSGGYTDTQEEYLDEKHSRKSTLMNYSTEYTEFNQYQDSTSEAELATNPKTATETVKYSEYYIKEYPSTIPDEDIFSASKSTYSTKVVTNTFSPTTIPYQGTSKEKQTFMDKRRSRKPSLTSTQSTSNARDFSQTSESVIITFPTPKTIPYQGTSGEKQNVSNETHSRKSTSTSNQSKIVINVTEGIQTQNGVTSPLVTPQTIPSPGISTQKQIFSDERRSKKSSSTSTQSTLLRNVTTEWNQTPKSVTIQFQSNSTEKQFFLDKMYTKKPQMNFSPNTTGLTTVKEMFSTPTTVEYRNSTDKQHFLDEIYSKIPQSSTTVSESTESMKLNESQATLSNRLSTSKITQELLDFYLSSVAQKSSTQPNSNMKESKPFIQSERLDKLKDVSTTKSTAFSFLTSNTESVQEVVGTSSTRGVTKDTTSLNNLLNMTTVQNNQTAFSNIVELLSVTGSLLPLTESLTHLDKAETQTGSKLEDRHHSSTIRSHTIIADEELVVENFDLGSLNKVDGAVCDGHICRKAAAKTLYQIDFESDVCKYPQTYFCGGGKTEKWDFLDMVFKDLISFIKRIDEQSSTHYQVFANTFHMCNEFNSFSILEHVNKDHAALPKEYKDLIGQLLLTQSAPFFDIEVIPIGNLFQIQISPPGLNIWKTSTYRWSLLNHVRSSCLDEATQWLNTTVDIKLISEDIKICCRKKLTSFVQKYSENTLKNKTHIIKPKIEYFFETYEDPESNYVNITMKEFCDSKDYYLGSEWRDLFLKIGVPYNATSIIRIHYPEQVKLVISQAMREFTDILKAWYLIQTYSNMIQLLLNKNNARYCLELVSELMPDVASVMVQEAVDESMYNDSLITVKTLFDGLKQTLIKSLPKMFKQKKDLKMFKDKLNQVCLMSSTKLIVEETYVVKMENTFYGSVMELLKRRRKSVFGLLKEKVKVKFLLKYFVSPFDSRLHTFLPLEIIVFQPGFLYRAFEMEFLPREVYLSKIGFILAAELIKFYVSVERGQSKVNDLSEYGYLIEGDEYLFVKNQMKRDKMAFELIVRRLFEDSREIERMSWLNGTFSNSQAFVTSTIQEFCDWSTAADVTKDLYNNQVPSAFRIRNLMLSSKFALKSFNCQ